MDFQAVIKNGGFATPFEHIRNVLPRLAGAHFEEIKALCNTIATNHSQQRAEIFVRIIATHLWEKDWDRYNIVMRKYRSWINEYIQENR